MGPQYVLVGFATTGQAQLFLEQLNEMPDELSRKLLLAEKLPNGKVKLHEVQIRTAYMKEYP